MFEKIKLFFAKRRLRKEIEQSSFNCSSMEMASDDEWKELNLGDKYEVERSKLDNLRTRLNQLQNA